MYVPTPGEMFVMLPVYGVVELPKYQTGFSFVPHVALKLTDSPKQILPLLIVGVTAFG